MPCFLIFSMSTACGLPWHIILLQLRPSLLSLNYTEAVVTVGSDFGVQATSGHPTRCPPISALTPRQAAMSTVTSHQRAGWRDGGATNGPHHLLLGTWVVSWMTSQNQSDDAKFSSTAEEEGTKEGAGGRQGSRPARLEHIHPRTRPGTSPWGHLGRQGIWNWVTHSLWTSLVVYWVACGCRSVRCRFWSAEFTPKWHEPHATQLLIV